MKVKEWFRKLVAGLAIGAGAAIPGVSGAAIAVIFHVYEDIIGAVNNFRKKFGWAIKVLIPILLGIVIAVGICIVVFSYAFEYMMFVLICLFAGFLIGSFPGITDEVKGEKITKKNVLLIAAGALFVIALGVANILVGLSDFDVKVLFENPQWYLYLILIPVGAVAAVALTVPGLSGSLILLILGFYRPLVDFAKGAAGELIHGDFTRTGPLFGVLGCFAIGCLIGVVLVSKIMNILLKKWRKETFFVIIGFIGGSILVLFANSNIVDYYRTWASPEYGNKESINIHPVLPMWLEIIIGVAILALCAFLSYLLVVAQRKRAALEVKENEELPQE